jgi:hypothetical protein
MRADPKRVDHLGELAFALLESEAGHPEVDVHLESFPVRITFSSIRAARSKRSGLPNEPRQDLERLRRILDEVERVPSTPSRSLMRRDAFFER